jgi:hypothetical protein
MVRRTKHRVSVRLRDGIVGGRDLGCRSRRSRLRRCHPAWSCRPRAGSTPTRKQQRRRQQESPMALLVPYECAARVPLRGLTRVSLVSPPLSRLEEGLYARGEAVFYTAGILSTRRRRGGEPAGGGWSRSASGLVLPLLSCGKHCKQERSGSEKRVLLTVPTALNPCFMCSNTRGGRECAPQ